MQQYTSNAIHTLTNEQRKALAQCLVLGARPAEVLLHTKYVLISPLGDLELAAEAGQDWLKLHQEGYGIDPITGEIVAQATVGTNALDSTLRVNDAPFLPVALTLAPFTPAQERRIREIVVELIRRALADSAEEAE